MRASVSSAPDRSPTTPTRSPTAMPLRPSSRARIAVTSTPSTSTPYRPRSTVITMPSTASVCAGRCLERGRVPRRPARDADVVLVHARDVAPGHQPPTQRRPLPGKSGIVLVVAPMSSTCTPSTREPQHRPGLRHAVVGVGAPGAAVQWARDDRAARRRAGRRAAQAGQLGRQRGEPVGLVPAQVREPGQLRRAVGQRGQRREHGRQLADVVQVGDQAGDVPGRARSARPARVAPRRPSRPAEPAARRRPVSWRRASPARAPRRR